MMITNGRACVHSSGRPLRVDGLERPAGGVQALGLPPARPGHRRRPPVKIRFDPRADRGVGREVGVS